MTAKDLRLAAVAVAVVLLGAWLLSPAAIGWVFMLLGYVVLPSLIVGLGVYGAASRDRR